MSILSDIGTKIGAKFKAEKDARILADTSLQNSINSISLGTADDLNITKVSECGFNGIHMIINGKIYTSSGNSVSHSNRSSGRGLDNRHFFYGMDGFREVVLPYNKGLKSTWSTGYSMLALFNDGSLYAWGYNSFGQLGAGHTSSIAFPTLVQTGVTELYSDVASQGFGMAYTTVFIKKTDGYIYGTGYNGYGQLGIGNTTQQNSFIQITALGTDVIFLQCSSRYGSTFTQKSNGTIWACGYNGYGQIGDGTTASKSSFIDVTTKWGGISAGPITKLESTSGYYDTAASTKSTTLMLRTSGSITSLRSAGNSEWGQGGNGGTSNILTPYLIPNSDNIQDIKMFGGSPATVNMLNNDGNLYTWGYGTYGAHGLGSFLNVLVPTLAINGVQSLFEGSMNSYTYSYKSQNYIKKDNKLWACGYSDSTEYLGYGAATSQSTFKEVMLPDSCEPKLFGGFYTTSAGRINVCISTDNKLYAWGYNTNNGITQHHTSNVYLPQKFDLSNIT